MPQRYRAPLLAAQSMLALTLVLSGCVSKPTGPAARADLSPTAGHAARGWVQFVQQGDTVNVIAEVRNLKPNAEHGFHVHERGDCSASDAASAGGHFDPAGQPHGHHGQAERHAGDMPNLQADDRGVARLEWRTDRLTVHDGAKSVVGRGVVVHRNPDDYATQPAGDSGARVACGVVNTR